MSTTVNHTLRSSDGKTCIEFTWVGDRFQHKIEHHEGSSTPWHCLSVEGTADQVWATSPPLQQLSTETIDNQEMILGVGGGGTSHYSVCVRLIETEECVDVHLDWAVRLSKTKDSPRLNNTYRGRNLRLVAEVLSRIEPTDEPDLVRVVAQPALGERTVRWSYRVRISPLHP